MAICVPGDGRSDVPAGPGYALSRCTAWPVTATAGEERGPDAILAFPGAGLFQRPSRAQAVAALAAARRGIAACQAHRAPVRPWLAGEVHLRGIRETAVIKAVRPGCLYGIDLRD